MKLLPCKITKDRANFYFYNFADNKTAIAVDEYATDILNSDDYANIGALYLNLSAMFSVEIVYVGLADKRKKTEKEYDFVDNKIAIKIMGKVLKNYVFFSSDNKYYFVLKKGFAKWKKLPFIWTDPKSKAEISFSTPQFDMPIYIAHCKEYSDMLKSRNEISKWGLISFLRSIYTVVTINYYELKEKRNNLRIPAHFFDGRIVLRNLNGNDVVTHAVFIMPPKIAYIFWGKR